MRQSITRYIIGGFSVLMVNIAGISLVHHLHALSMTNQFRDILSFGIGAMAATISIPIFEYIHDTSNNKRR